MPSDDARNADGVTHLADAITCVIEVINRVTIPSKEDQGLLEKAQAFLAEAKATVSNVDRGTHKRTEETS